MSKHFSSDMHERKLDWRTGQGGEATSVCKNIPHNVHLEDYCTKSLYADLFEQGALLFTNCGT
jgi:hypothetical protein